MGLCVLDSSIQRLVVDGFSFPLGVYPVEACKPVQGYSVAFEPADGGDDEWEQWPDRYVYEIVVGADLLPALCRNLLMLMPPRVYPILDFLGHDAYREIDPFLAYEPVGLDHVIEGLRKYRAFLYEDGLCGWGAMAEDPFFYLFVDEHKIITIRIPAELRDQMDALLAFHGLTQVEEPSGADSVEHEHRTVLLAPETDPESMTAEEIVDALREDWRLSLNVDPETNVDDEGNDLGVTAWRSLVRVPDAEGDRFVEVLLAAPCMRRAEELALEASAEVAGESDDESHHAVIIADRITPDHLRELVGSEVPPLSSFAEGRIFRAGWVE